MAVFLSTFSVLDLLKHEWNASILLFTGWLIIIFSERIVFKFQPTNDK